MLKLYYLFGIVLIFDLKFRFYLEDICVCDQFLLDFPEHTFSLAIFDDHSLHLGVELRVYFSLGRTIHRLHELLQDVLEILDYTAVDRPSFLHQNLEFAPV